MDNELSFHEKVEKKLAGKIAEGPRPTINLIQEHKNQKQFVYRGHWITVAQKVKDNTWTYSADGDDNGGYKSEADAIRGAKSLIDNG